MRGGHRSLRDFPVDPWEGTGGGGFTRPEAGEPALGPIHWALPPRPVPDRPVYIRGPPRRRRGPSRHCRRGRRRRRLGPSALAPGRRKDFDLGGGSMAPSTFRLYLPDSGVGGGGGRAVTFFSSTPLLLAPNLPPLRLPGGVSSLASGVLRGRRRSRGVFARACE